MNIGANLFHVFLFIAKMQKIPLSIGPFEQIVVKEIKRTGLLNGLQNVF